MGHKHVLDTHALVWYLEGNPRLGANAKDIIDDPNSELVLPVIALAEAAFIIERGRTSVSSVSDLLDSIRADARIAVFPITLTVFEQSLAAQVVEEMHDRLIVGTVLYLQSLGESASLLTKDAAITGAKLVEVIW